MRTIAYVDLQPNDRGTRVEVTLRSHPFIAAFMTFWLGLVAVFVAVASLVAAQLWATVVAFLLLAFGFAFIALGRWFVRSERTALLEFIGVVLSPR
jgi:hypothetical protein